MVTAPDTMAGDGGVGVGNFDSCPESAEVRLNVEPLIAAVTANIASSAIATAPTVAASTFFMSKLPSVNNKLSLGPTSSYANIFRFHISLRVLARDTQEALRVSLQRS